LLETLIACGDSRGDLVDTMVAAVLRPAPAEQGHAVVLE
jgi:hypothetical protein